MPTKFNQNLSDADLRLLFASSPDQDMILTPDFRIIAGTAAYIAIAGRPLEEIVGKNLFEAFPDNPSDPHRGTERLRDSLERVVKTGKPDRLAPFRYDIPFIKNGVHDFQERYWSPVNTPIFDEHGQLKFIVHRVHDATASVSLQQQNAAFAARLRSQDTELLLRVVANSLPAFVSYMGSDHRYKFVNEFYAKWFGRPTESIEGRTRAELVGDETTTNYLSEYETRAFRGERCAFETTLTKPNGEFIILDTEYVPDIDPLTGVVMGIVGVGQDITSRKIALQESQSARLDAERTEARFRNLSDSLPTLMWTWLPNVGVNYINTRAKDYLGISSAAEFSSGFIKALGFEPGEGLAAQKAWYQGVETGKTFSVQTRLMGIDGKPRWFLHQVTPIRDAQGKIEYWITTATDINEERRIADELFEAKNAAENANRAKTEFLANMSHEIRTPLNSILGFSELMRDPEIDDAERAQYASTIGRNGTLLTRIIDDILDLAKVESGRMEAEEVTFSLHESIDEVKALFNDAAKQKKIALKSKIDSDVPDAIISDPTRLRQILINVFGNAVKFTDSGSVEIDVSRKPSRDGKFELDICVTDTGRGIPADQRDRLFKPFTQADSSTTRRYGGTGLGLALSRRLAETLGGTLELDQAHQGTGTTFIIRVLVREASTKVSLKMKTVSSVAQMADLLNTKKTEALPLEGLRVLVVDDSIDNQTLVRHILKKLGAVVSVANNGRDGVQAALANAHDIVLMDIQMPEMDGYQALAALKEAGFETPVVALTAHALNEEREKTRSAGFTSHLTKPIDKAALLETITACTATR